MFNIINTVIGFVLGYIVALTLYLVVSILLAIPAFFIYNDVVVKLFDTVYINFYDTVLLMLLIKLIGSAFGIGEDVLGSGATTYEEGEEN
jgi:hypothetical protein